MRKNLPECLGSVFDCTTSLPTCFNSARFDFISLQNITLQYAEQCPDGPWLFRQPGHVGPIPDSQLSLNNDVCKAIAGADWKKYPGPDIYGRLTTWKFPLFQLVASSPRPPLGFWAEAFTFTHFLGDPMGSISELLRKLDSCQTRAVFWRHRLHDNLILLRDERDCLERQRLWKSLAAIVDSFDEWGLDKGNEAQEYLLKQLTHLCSPEVDDAIRHKFIYTCLQTGDALAADRSTKFLPIIIAQSFFIASVAIAMIRTKATSGGPQPTTYSNIEIYSIAFTAQYFWVIFAVFWTSIIGVSQTAAAVPRILNRFRQDLERSMSDCDISTDLPIRDLTDHRRIFNGGIYAWQPGRRRMSLAHNSSWLRPVVYHLLPFTMVAAAAGTGQLLSALVPPVGWSCRSNAMMSMFAAWTASYVISLIPVHESRLRLYFWATFIKDVVVIGVTFGIIIVTQFGIYNRCDCYTGYGKVGLQLPFMPAVRDILQSRLSNVYPTVVTLGIIFQLVIVPGLLIWRYHAAVQVFLQRDDGTSNLDWWHMFRKWRRDSRPSKNKSAADSAQLVVHAKDEEAGCSVSVVEIENAVEADRD